MRVPSLWRGGEVSCINEERVHFLVFSYVVVALQSLSSALELFLFSVFV